MTKVMEGVRVVEVAEYAMGPAAGVVLADWGADVVKIEHPERGDALRGVAAWGVEPGTGGFSALWETFNRGKRSVGIDLSTEDGRAVLLELVADCDVFITNYLPSTRAKLRIDPDDVRLVNPQVIYARGSAFGPFGDEADRGGFDGSVYWQRSGAGNGATPPSSPDLTPLPGPAFGDIQTGTTLAGGIAAALFHRERTGQAEVVDTSLLAAGMWAMQASLVGANTSGLVELPTMEHTSTSNPLSNTYRTSDGRFVALSMLQADRFWPNLCRALGLDHLIDDERFATFQVRAANSEACIAELDAVFAQHTLAEMARLLATQDGPWTVAQRVGELNDDGQAWANGYLRDVDYGDGRTLRLVPAPVQFATEPSELRPAPQVGASTEEVLLELGHEWDEIIRLKDAGAIS